MTRPGRTGPLLALVLVASACGSPGEGAAPVGEAGAPGAPESSAPAGPAQAAAGPVAPYLVGPGGRTHRLTAAPPPAALVLLEEEGVCGDTVAVEPVAADTGSFARELTPMLEIPGWGERIVRRPFLAFPPGSCPARAGRLGTEWSRWSSRPTMDRAVLDTLGAAAGAEGATVFEAVAWTVGDTTWTWAILGTHSGGRLVGLTGGPGSYRVEHVGTLEGWTDRAEYAHLVAFGDLRGDGRLALVLTVPTPSRDWSARQSVRVLERTPDSAWQPSLDRPLVEVLDAG